MKVRKKTFKFYLQIFDRCLKYFNQMFTDQDGVINVTSQKVFYDILIFELFRRNLPGNLLSNKNEISTLENLFLLENACLISFCWKKLHKIDLTSWNFFRFRKQSNLPTYSALEKGWWVEVVPGVAFSGRHHQYVKVFEKLLCVGDDNASWKISEKKYSQVYSYLNISRKVHFLWLKVKQSWIRISTLKY